MVASLCGALLLILAFCEGPASALQWTNPALQGMAHVLTCEGSDVSFPWTFSLGPGEQVEDIKWLYTPPSGASDLMANYMYGQFIPVASFQGRLTHKGNGSIVLKQVGRQDRGEYVIEVGLMSNGSQFSTHRQSAVLDIPEPPSTEQLTISAADQPVYDNSTGQFHLQLACGQLSFVGQPPATVIWTTPSGAEVGSTYSTGGTYFLSVPSPVKSGKYSCRLAPPSSGPNCQLPSDLSLQNASMTVDGTEVRLMLLEAKAEALKADNDKLKTALSNMNTENSQLKKDLNSTKTSLTAENQRLQQQQLNINSTLETHNNQLKVELRLTEDLLNMLKNDVSGLKNVQNLTASTLTARVIDLDSRLVELRGKLSERVSFHAKLSHTPRFSHNVVFDSVVTNEGLAYDGHSGRFHVPVNGTYFFAFTASPSSVDHYSNCELMVDGHPISKLQTRYIADYFNMATSHVVLPLLKGQSVWVQGTGQSLSFAPDLSFFSGFLISPQW